MLYVDTCVLVSLFVRDSGAESAVAWLEQSAGQVMMASRWSLTEFSSSTAGLVRQRLIPAKLHSAALKNFRNFAAQRLTLEPASALDFEYATRLIDHTERGLRAGDALHLALCQRLNATIFSADKVMLITAKKLGIAVEQI